jgi:hypothetical protein
MTSTCCAELQVYTDMFLLPQRALISLSQDSGGGMAATQQQLLDLLSLAMDGQQQQQQQFSILHISCYHADADYAAAAAAYGIADVPVAGGCEAHVDRGLLTLIADSHSVCDDVWASTGCRTRSSR